MNREQFDRKLVDRRTEEREWEESMESIERKGGQCWPNEDESPLDRKIDQALANPDQWIVK